MIHPRLAGSPADVDSEADSPLVRAFETAAGRDYAFEMTYHPSGALETYTAFNNIATTITYDPNRYWVQSVTAGPPGVLANAEMRPPPNV